MKAKHVLLTGAFAGAIGFGAMLGPIALPSAATDTQAPAPAVVPAQAITANDVVCPTTGGQAGARMGQYFAGTMQEVIAKALGISTEELQAARYDGKSVADLAAEKGIKEDELLADMKTAREDQLNQLVADKVITEDQKAYKLENMDENMKAAIERTTTGPMNGRGKGGHGRWANSEGSQTFQPGQGFGGGRWAN